MFALGQKNLFAFSNVRVTFWSPAVRTNALKWLSWRCRLTPATKTQNSLRPVQEFFFALPTPNRSAGTRNLRSGWNLSVGWMIGNP